MKFHELHFPNLNGAEVPFSVFRGKVCLVVNIASQCGFTPQLRDLETLYLSYKNRGFEVLGFPSNDFGKQEPLSNEGIGAFCQDQYAVTFQLFEKSTVKGKEANAVFRFLCEKKFKNLVPLRPYWNFQKYLVDRNGNLSDFFLPFTNPNGIKMRRKIEQLL